MRYLLFVGDNYYPQSAWDDFISSSNSIDELIDEASQYQHSDWYQIVDLDDLRVVCVGDPKMIKQASCLHPFERVQIHPPPVVPKNIENTKNEKKRIVLVSGWLGEQPKATCLDCGKKFYE